MEITLPSAKIPHGAPHPAMRPTVETVEEGADTPLTVSLVNTPYIVEQLFPLSAAALSQNTLPAASPVTAPVSVQTPTFQSDIAAGKRRANDHSSDATPRTTLSPSPEPFRPAPPPYVASTLDVFESGEESGSATRRYRYQGRPEGLMNTLREK
ncbi:hypothetical protein C8R44DRAFT_753091 [Mycena epipterygia]|nr:hypothetical protein C8R44DRAFT_753091 [Mycena epipterygia]